MPDEISGVSSAGESDDLDDGTPRAARIYNYLLGGSDNFAVDREAAEPAVAMVGGWENARDNVWAQRDFLRRAVRFLAQEAGIRQFLDIGCGIPTQDNTHEVAQRLVPEARIVYVDYDPIVARQSAALLTSTPEGAAVYVEADLRDVDTIVEAAAATLDFTRPVAVMLLGVLHHIPDHEDPWSLVARLMASVPSGSYVVISQLASESQTEVTTEMAEHFDSTMAEPMVARTRAQVTRFFDGLELIDPGVVLFKQWRPEGPEPIRRPERHAPGHCGVARKP